MVAFAASAACVTWAEPVFGQADTGTYGPVGTSEVSDVARIGRVHESLRRSTGRHALYQALVALYGDYSRFKARVQRETGLQWSLDATFTQQ